MKIKIWILSIIMIAFIVPSFVFAAPKGGFADGVWGSLDEPQAAAFTYKQPVNKTTNITGPVPSNDWWTGLLVRDDSMNKQVTITPYPLYYFPCNNVAPAEDGAFGLAIAFWGQGYGAGNKIQSQRVPDMFIWNGSQDKASTKTKLDGFGDWHIRLETADSSGRKMLSTIAAGSPFSYHTFESGNPRIYLESADSFYFYTKDGAAITLNDGGTYNGDHLIVKLKHRQDGTYRYYGLFAAPGTTWTRDSTRLNLTSSYVTIALLTSPSAAPFYYSHAYSMITNTKADYAYDEASASVTTTFQFFTKLLREDAGFSTNVLTMLFPHQFKHIGSGYTASEDQYVLTQRGKMKLIEGNTFKTVYTNYGILSFFEEPKDSPYYNHETALTYLRKNQDYSFNVDTYGTGKCMLRVSESIELADRLGETNIKNRYIDTLYNELANWFTFSGLENEPHFIYNGADLGATHFMSYFGTASGGPGTLIPFRTGYGIQALNDGHFHFGYFIHAAATLAKYRPDFVSDYGWAVEELVRQIASPDRNDPKYPYLRYFSPYTGRSYASGYYWDDNFQGNDQESSSEAMHAWSAVYQWGLITGNKTIRDTGLYMYWTEKSADDEYWFNVDQDNLLPAYGHIFVTQLRETAYEYSTYFGTHPEYYFGIETMPITPSTLYFGLNQNYLKRYWGALTNECVIENGQIFSHWDLRMLRLWSLLDPTNAFKYYQYGKPSPSEEFDVVGTHDSWPSSYYFLNNMALLGQPTTDITADKPSYGVFKKGNNYNYVAFNPSTTAPMHIRYYDSNKNIVKEFDVAAGETKYSTYTDDLPPVSPSITNLVLQGNNVQLDWAATARASGYKIVYGTATNNMNQTQDVGNVISYNLPLANGSSTVYYIAIYAYNANGNSCYSKTYTTGPDPDIHPIQGKIEAEDCYLNFGAAAQTCDEGTQDIGWIDDNDYLDYQVVVNDSGWYTVDYRVAGMSDGEIVIKDGAPDPNNPLITTTIPASGGWQTWKTVTSGEFFLSSGNQLIRLYAQKGGFNLNWMDFKLIRSDSKPSKPSITYSVAKDSQITLNWSHSATADSYFVKYGTASGVYSTVTNVGNVQSTTLSNLNNETKYYIVVSATNTYGESDNSLEMNSTPMPYDGHPDAPVNLLATVKSTNEIDLTWTDTATNETGYNLYQSTLNVKGNITTNLIANSTSYKATNLNPDTMYYFWLEATNLSGASDSISTSAKTSNTNVVLSTNQLIIKNVGNNDIKFSVTLNEIKDNVYLFAQRNSLQDWTPDITTHYTANGDGTYTYYITRTGCYTNGDVIKARIYTFSMASGQVRYPGPGDNDWSPAFTVLDTPAPLAVPVLNTATSDNAKVHLAWTASAGATGYKVKYGTQSGNYTVTNDVGNVTASDVINLVNDQKYYFAVSAYDAGQESSNSLELNATPANQDLTTPVINSIVSGNKEIILNWASVPNATGYKVKFGRASGNYSALRKVGATTFTATNLINNIRYYFTVIATNAAGESPSAEEVCEHPVPGVFNSPVISAPVVSDKAVALTWSPVNLPGDLSNPKVNYTVYYGTKSHEYTFETNVSTSTACQINGLNNDTTYYFTIYALVTADNGFRKGLVYSLEKPGTPKLPTVIPPAPEITSLISGANCFSINWNASTGANSYFVKYGTQSGVWNVTTNVGNASSFVANSLVSGTYYVVMSATNNVGESTNSGEKSILVNNFSLTSPQWNYAIPSDGEICLNWQPVNGASSYKIKYGTVSGNYTTETNIGNVTSASIAGLNNSSVYYIVITAKNATEESAVSAEKNCTPEAGLFNQTSLANPSAGSGSVTLSWDSVTLPAGFSDLKAVYIVKYGTASQSYTSQTNAGENTGCQVTGLANGTQYFFTISTLVTNSSGFSKIISNSAEKTATPIGSAEYTLVWSDEFNGTDIDKTKWKYDIGTGPGGDGWGNWELEYYTDTHKNSYISNNCLVIEAKREANKINGMDFSSARLTTKGLMQINHGKVQARIKMPNANRGLWPAFWMLGANIDTDPWPFCGEIDIAEMGEKTEVNAGLGRRVVHGTPHWGIPGGGDGGHGHAMQWPTMQYTNETALDTDFHLYELYWDSNVIKMYVDTTQYQEMYISNMSTNASMDELRTNQFYLLLNLAVGGLYPGISDANNIDMSDPKMLVDYVRVYQNDGGTIKVSPPTSVTGKFGIFTEANDCTGSINFGTDGHLYVWQNLNITVGTPQEGTNDWKITAAPTNWFGAGVMAGEKDLTRYCGGYMHVSIKTTATHNFKIGMKSSDGNEGWVQSTNMAQYGFTNNGVWHEVKIPISAFPNIELGNIQQYFMIAGEQPSSTVTYEIDNIWLEEGPAQPVFSGNTFGVYTENTACADTLDFATLGTIDIWNNLTSKTGTPYEGTKCLDFATTTGDWYGFGIRSKLLCDMTAFKNGYMNFRMKVPSQYTGNFKLGIKSSTGRQRNESWIEFNNGADPFGFVRDGTWRSVRIPMSQFKDSDFSKISHFLMLAGSAGQMEVQFDDIYWEK